MTGKDLPFGIALQQTGGGWLVRTDGKPGDHRGGCGWLRGPNWSKGYREAKRQGYSGSRNRQDPTVVRMRAMGEAEESGMMPRFLSFRTGWRVVPALS